MTPKHVGNLSVDQFIETAQNMKNQSAALAAEWATETDHHFEVYACYRQEKTYSIVKLEIAKDHPQFPSLSSIYLSANRFERQIYSLMGITPLRHPDLRPWIKFEDWPADLWPLRKTVDAKTQQPRVPGDYAWIQAKGEGVFEIPVGPVHAGIIEPGHFRFQAVGETILHLEERLGYVHKGIEKRFEAMDWLDGYQLAGRVSGDSTIAHSLAYCKALESMTHCQVPDRASWLRALFLERERIINHVGDIGAICNDAAFVILFHQFMRLKEHLLRTNNRLWGHRFMMDCIVPGGVTVDMTAAGINQIHDELDDFEKEFNALVKIYDGNPSLEERVLDTGILSKAQALDLDVVGYVARASGVSIDCRVNHPFAPYDQMEIRLPQQTAGDVNARVWVRIEEVRESIRIIHWLLSSLPNGALHSPCLRPAANQTGFAAVEGWRGETLYWLQSDSRAHINRCMVRDPSSVNWLALESAVMGNIVPDFPLCNKSFNGSYSGNDL